MYGLTDIQMCDGNQNILIIAKDIFYKVKRSSFKWNELESDEKEHYILIAKYFLKHRK